MQGPREAKRILNRYRKRRAKRGQKNGGYGWLDDLWLERLMSNSKKRYRRHLAPPVTYPPLER